MSEPTKGIDAGTILRLIAEVGAPAAVELVDIFMRGGEVTPEMWIGLRGKIRTPFDTLVPQRGTANG